VYDKGIRFCQQKRSSLLYKGLNVDNIEPCNQIGAEIPQSKVHSCLEHFSQKKRHFIGGNFQNYQFSEEEKKDNYFFLSLLNES
jgi:hypothetical protein